MTSQLYPNNHYDQSYEDHYNLNNVLLNDHMDLVSFSETMREYGISAKEFNDFFEEGLLKSLEFFSSSAHINHMDLNNLIQTNLCGDLNLNHHIEKSQTSVINLEKAISSLSEFSGEWHGNWEKEEVHHLWLPVRKFVQKITDRVTLLGFQSCFTGDGFGWNYIVKKGNEIVILGFVFHFDTSQNIISKNPHYAFLNNNRQLIWVSNSHIYYEFICNNSNCFDKRHYVISGVTYKKKIKELKFTHGFQAIYLPDNEDLPAFKNINLNRLNF